MRAREWRPARIPPTRVAHLLSWLEERPYSRHELAQATHWKDRYMRRVIEEAQRQGHLIIWDRETQEYRFARSLEDYRHWRQVETLSRMGSLAAKLRPMDESAARKWPVEQVALGI